MNSRTSRRRFLKQAGLAGAGLVASHAVFALPGYSPGSGRTAKATLGLVAPRDDFNRRLFGAFLEHLGRSIYTGVYDPGNPLSAAPLWAFGPELVPLLTGLPGPPFELSQLYERSVASGLEIGGFEIGKTRDLTRPEDLIRENFPYLGS